MTNQYEIYSEKFYEELPAIIEKIEVENTDVPNIGLEDYKKQIDIVERFISRNKLKIYGGVSLNKFMPDDDKIYKNREGKIVDFDIYSPMPKKHCVELGNELFKSGFKYVDIREGVHAGVYKIFNYFQEVADVVYIPERIYNLIPYKTMNGMNYVLPKYMKIDMLVSLTNPQQSMFRWKKDYERLQKLEKYFSTEKPKNFVEKKSKYVKSEMEKKIYEYIIKRDDVIFFGDIAYYAYMKSSGLADYYSPEVKYIEIGVQNSSAILKDIQQFGKIKIKKYHPFLKYIPVRYIVSPENNDNHIVLIVYELNEKCVPYVLYNKIKISSYHSLVLYYNFMYYLSACYGIRDRKDVVECCLYELDRAKKYYFARTGENEFSNSLFRYFITSCVGIEKNLLADSKVRKWKKERTFTYTPDKREYLVLAEKVPAGIVYNMSGEFDKEVK